MGSFGAKPTLAVTRYLPALRIVNRSVEVFAMSPTSNSSSWKTICCREVDMKFVAESVIFAMCALPDPVAISTHWEPPLLLRYSRPLALSTYMEPSVAATTPFGVPSPVRIPTVRLLVESESLMNSDCCALDITMPDPKNPPLSTASVPLDASEFFAYTVEPETVRNRSIDPVSVEFTLSAVPFRLNPWPAVSELPPVWSVPHEKRPVVASHSNLLVVLLSQSLRPAPEKLRVA